MKILGRTLLIFAAALVVCGITWGVGRSLTFSGGGRGDRPGVAIAGQTNGPAGADFAPRGRPEGGGGFFGVMEVGQNLVLLAIVTTAGQVVIAVLRRWFPTPADRRKMERTA